MTEHYGARQGNYDEADSSYLRAIRIQEKIRSSDHRDLASTLNNRAELLRAQGKHEQAETLFKRSLAIREKALGPEHPDVAMSLNNLAVLLKHMGNDEGARLLYARAIDIGEEVLGLEHPDYAILILNSVEGEGLAAGDSTTWENDGTPSRTSDGEVRSSDKGKGKGQKRQRTSAPPTATSFERPSGTAEDQSCASAEFDTSRMLIDTSLREGDEGAKDPSE